ncbi:hypothetical protein [Croceitalea vernalis]|uniref:Uncharacterized protein n=1 Tax=Croceitalea vernalis TaxID=3075599 RepID=A0ABU3BF19_9FLAO|nr:hypothetical protein [Croceitalea sp. P007]MDT0620723.1 hypothetical protein [Croceitalea sp. P007]
MEILKIATEWAKSEVFSARFFIFFAILFLIASVGFWQLGKTEMAKAYIIPTLVVGLLILAVGVGIFFTNKSRITSFEEAYQEDPTEFVKSEIIRTEKSMGEYKTIVFKVIPLLIVVAALLIIFVDKPIWRATAITTIAMMIVILFVDSNADTRIQAYHQQLQLVLKQ